MIRFYVYVDSLYSLYTHNAYLYILLFLCDLLHKVREALKLLDNKVVGHIRTKDVQNSIDDGDTWTHTHIKEKCVCYLNNTLRGQIPHCTQQLRQVHGNIGTYLL